jgi:hypothetical protein
MPRQARPPLPFAVYVLAFLLLLKAGILVGVASGSPLVAVLFPDASSRELVRTPAGSAMILAGAGLIVLTVVAVLVRRRTGWLLAMLVTGCFVALDIAGFMQGTALHPWMLLNIVTVFYLNQSDVRDAVGVTQPETDQDDATGAPLVEPRP